MNRRVTIVAVTAGLLAGVPTAAWADQKSASSVVSYKKLASYLGRSDNGRGFGWGKGGKDNDHRPGGGNNGHHYGDDNGHHYGGDKSRGC